MTQRLFSKCNKFYPVTEGLLCAVCHLGTGALAVYGPAKTPCPLELTF